ncbi:DUF2796 domain-containing protein [Comamonadaceae bacterium M7527]|nr:DUF2796 domain-containing protein [Comamonadaceae bacterium M7527]
MTKQFVACALVCAFPLTSLASERHVHGQSNIELVVSGANLSLRWDMPLDTLVGFEHQAENKAQREALANAQAQLTKAGQWLKPTPAAQCVVASVDVDVPGVEVHEHEAHADHADHDGQAMHADAQWLVSWRCAKPQALQSVELLAMKQWPGMQTVLVQGVVNGRQFARDVRAPARLLALP